MIVVVSGHISSGKTTLAKQIAHALDAPLLSSDALRLALKNRPQGAGGDSVFALMADLAYKSRKNVVLDSTGMSFRFRELVDNIRKATPPQDVVHIRVACDIDTWYYREMTRSDRAPLSEAFYRESRDVAWNHEPEYTFQSTPDVFERAMKGDLRAVDRPDQSEVGVFRRRLVAPKAASLPGNSLTETPAARARRWPSPCRGWAGALARPLPPMR